MVVKEVGEDDDDDDDDNDEKSDLTLRVARLSITPAATEKPVSNDNDEKPDLTLHIPRVSFTVPSNDANAPLRASSAVEQYASNIAPSPINVIRRSSSVPAINIEIPTIVRPTSRVSLVQSPSGSANPRHHHRDVAPSNPLRRLGHVLHSLVKNSRARGVSQHLEEARLGIDGVEGGVEGGEGEGGSSTNTSDENLPHQVFEAFPKLNRMLWFNSIKVAIVFCGLTSVLVSINIVYNIVLAARGNSQ